MPGSSYGAGEVAAVKCIIGQGRSVGKVGGVCTLVTHPPVERFREVAPHVAESDNVGDLMRAPRVRLMLHATPLVATLIACSVATGPGLEFATARARWAQRGPGSYSITVRRSCECLPEMMGPVVVTVRNGVVESRQYTTNGAAVPSEYAELFPPVDGLFGVIETARRDGAARLDVSYDPTFGYPVRIAIDWHAVHVDDEVTYEAKDLVAR
jgi:uncharacterized protein DUF6174